MTARIYGTRSPCCVATRQTILFRNVAARNRSTSLTMLAVLLFLLIIYVEKVNADGVMSFVFCNDAPSLFLSLKRQNQREYSRLTERLLFTRRERQ